MYPSLQPIKASTKESTSWNHSGKVMPLKDPATAGEIYIRGSFIPQIILIFSGKQYGSSIVNKEQIQGVCSSASVADDF